MAWPRRILTLTVLSIGCQPTTTRPAFTPYPQAAATEIRLDAADATLRLAEALRLDSIPVHRVERRDAYLESKWFESATGKMARGRPLGPDVVRVRAWVERARPYSSTLIVETVYRPLADPSRADRELERPVPEDHPVAAKIRATLEAMVKKYGGPPAGAIPATPAATPPATTPPPATPRTP
jgi:hypothetical protein